MCVFEQCFRVDFQYRRVFFCWGFRCMRCRLRLDAQNSLMLSMIGSKFTGPSHRTSVEDYVLKYADVCSRQTMGEWTIRKHTENVYCGRATRYLQQQEYSLLCELHGVLVCLIHILIVIFLLISERSGLGNKCLPRIRLLLITFPQIETSKVWDKHLALWCTPVESVHWGPGRTFH